MAFGWKSGSGIDHAAMLNSVKGTTKVVDDICHYITSIDHEDASDRDQLREFKYDKYASATCRRADKVAASGLTNHFLPVTCT